MFRFHLGRQSRYIKPPIPQIADRFWPGPLLILQSKAIIPRITTGGLDIAALRSPEGTISEMLDQT